MSKLLGNKSYCERYGGGGGDDGETFNNNAPINDERLRELSDTEREIKAGTQNEGTFARITLDNRLTTGIYVGVQWFKENVLAIHIVPKLNKDNEQQTDYLKMFSCCFHSDVITREISYHIDFDKPFIEIEEEKQDLITPLLMLYFLKLLEIIVRKGLKKSYYRREQNLCGRVKGKILISQTLKQNILKNNPLKTFCQYDEFGINSFENRVLKRTLVFVQRYFDTNQTSSNQLDTRKLKQTINYCQAAFQEVDECKDLNELKNIKVNSFFKEYKEALRISSLILRRYSYNIKNIDNKETIKVPPYWINMQVLFELYVLSLLKEKYRDKGEIEYHELGNHGETDFLLTSKSGEERMIVDAKYKTEYNTKDYLIGDIRQLSGYARDKEILKKLGYEGEKEQNQVVDCLIIYPDTNPDAKSLEDLPDNLKAQPIGDFIKFYKIPIKLPQIQ